MLIRHSRHKRVINTCNSQGIFLMSEESTEPNPGDSNNPSNPSLSSLNNGTTAENARPSRNVTVTIQYSYLTPAGLANLTPNGLANLAFPQGNGVTANGADDNGGNGETTTGATDTEGTPMTRPDGALVLSFNDVPSGTPQERLESIVSIAAELAMRRFSDMVSQSKGITKEQFDQLPVIKVDEVPEKENAVCSICYSNYEDEATNLLKRNRDSELEESSIKKQRSESPALSINGVSQSNADTGPHVYASRPINNEGDHTNSNSHTDEDEPAMYKHSPTKLPCGHIFGRECLFRWSKLENSCPLCRAPLVEVAPEQRREMNNGGNNASAEVFERIRQLVYSPIIPGQEEAQVPQAEQAHSSDQNNGNNDTENQETGNRPFSFSRSGIVFLRPDSYNTSIIPQTTNNDESLTNAQENSNTNDTVARELAADNSSNFAQPSENVRTGMQPIEARRIQWIPIPITTVRLGNNEAQGSQNTHTDSNHNVYGERLRSILDRFFNMTHNENLRNQQNVPNQTSEPTENIVNDTNNINEQVMESRNAAPPRRRRSFLQNILRIASRSRNRTRNDINRADDNAADTHNEHQQHGSQDVGDMFSSGVASYRNQDGHVSTFNIGQGPLPSPSQNDRLNSSSNDTPEDSNVNESQDSTQPNE